MNSIKNILFLSLLVACMPIAEAHANKKTTPISASTQQELNRQLLEAVAANDIIKVKELLSRGANANATTEPTMYHAYHFGHAECYGGSALMFAATNGNAAICKLLLEHGAQVNALWLGGTNWTYRYYKNALALAAENGHLEACKVLIAYGADVDKKFQDEDEMVTPLNFARNNEIRELLLAHSKISWWHRASKKTKVTIVLGAIASAAGIGFAAYRLYRHFTQSAVDRISDALRANQNIQAAILRPGSGPENARKIDLLMADREINELINNQLWHAGGRHRIGELMTQEFINIINDPQFGNNIEQEAFVANIRQQLLHRLEDLA